MAEDQELVAVWRLAVKPVVDLGVGAAEAHADHLHGDVVVGHLRVWHVPHVDAVFFSGANDDRFHNGTYWKSVSLKWGFTGCAFDQS